ncbi:hypothetical protein Tdes44962_MAKER07125 [Teratosphaeria destructans]|uniref:Uncharacterized protein n=1 Tax=Teratosphaeria destructans TaxID=418781 RepID=A0A9W7W6P1_9PEZI|nr:hypothetical protein Tdes44962_MAKER07125 [Teratosphaeria destructans]
MVEYHSSHQATPNPLHHANSIASPLSNSTILHPEVHLPQRSDIPPQIPSQSHQIRSNALLNPPELPPTPFPTTRLPSGHRRRDEDILQRQTSPQQQLELPRVLAMRKSTGVAACPDCDASLESGLHVLQNLEHLGLRRSGL